MSRLRWVILIIIFALVSLTGALGYRFCKGKPKAEALVEREKALPQRLEQQSRPLLTKGGERSCMGCHDGENSTELHLFADAGSS